MEFVARGQTDEMLDRIYKSFETYRRNFDLVVVEGTHEDARAIGVLRLCYYWDEMVAMDCNIAGIRVIYSSSTLEHRDS